MPGALSKGLRFGPDPAASGAYPAAREAGATTNLDDLLGERGFSTAEGHLDGHTMAEAIFYGKGLRDAGSAIRFFFEEHKINKKLLMKALEKYEGFTCLPLSEECVRPRTTNWKGDPADAILTSNACWLGEAQLIGLLNKHCGEVRTWTAGPEKWVAAPERQNPFVQYGAFHDQTFIDKTVEKRQQSASGECFSSDRYETDGCQPDFENAISTFAVWDKRAEMVCVRDVPGVTLAAVLQHYKDDRPFRQLYGAWCEGRLLIRSKPTRGTTAGRRRTWKANWSGRQWRQGEPNNWSGRQWRQGKYHNWSCRQWRQEKSNNGWGRQWRCKELDSEWLHAGGEWWCGSEWSHGESRGGRSGGRLKSPPPKRHRRQGFFQSGREAHGEGATRGQPVR